MIFRCLKTNLDMKFLRIYHKLGLLWMTVFFNADVLYKNDHKAWKDESLIYQHTYYKFTLMQLFRALAVSESSMGGFKGVCGDRTIVQLWMETLEDGWRLSVSQSVIRWSSGEPVTQQTHRQVNTVLNLRERDKERDRKGVRFIFIF